VGTGEPQTDSSFGGKFSPEANFKIGARNSVDISKAKFPDRTASSNPAWSAIISLFSAENWTGWRLTPDSTSQITLDFGAVWAFPPGSPLPG
jgi:hypothetical protein